MGTIRSSLGVAAVALLGAGVASCGSSPPVIRVPAVTGPAPALSGGNPADQQAVVAAVTDYYKALEAHRGPQACSHLTPIEQRRLAAKIAAQSTHFGRNCTQILGSVGLLLSGQVRLLSVAVRANTATVALQGKARSTLTLTKASGRWLISDAS